MSIKEPTADQCSDNDLVYQDENQIGYACWYPQMGGYVGKAIALFDRKQKADFMDPFDGACVDVLIWHDGEFPFSKDAGVPKRLHHCVPEQFIEFGKFMTKINSMIISQNNRED